MLGGSHQRSAGRGKTRARANVISKSILAGRLDQVVCDVAVNVARLSTKAKLPPRAGFRCWLGQYLGALSATHHV